ncbi:MAG: sarcosine oxidase subunit gamma family protein, partial [Anaerolineae bacterium]
HNGKIRVEGMAAGQLLAADELAINGGKQTTFGRIYRLRRDLFFVTTAPDTVEEVAASLADQAANAESLITVTDVTHGNAELWLVGPQAAALLSRLCGLDFHDSRFPNGTAKRSSVAKTAQIIIRRDMVGKQTVPAYTLIGARSFAAYLWQTILAAGRDLSVQPVGQAALIPA